MIRISYDNGESMEVVDLSSRMAVCKARKHTTVGWSKYTVNNKLLQRMRGHRRAWALMIENSTDEDCETIKRLSGMVDAAMANGGALTLYPDYDSEAGENIGHSVRCMSAWQLGDLSKKRNVAQRAEEIVFEAVSLAKEEDI